ncbi:kynurenine formamidase [Chiloscyllium plagiosum]|uniref:kynurenine formamidase n=1 Tax=Chiloscyllium plagiosum TaxID=36176 RepID=UPI001CB81EB6|nr:kynurenine formamidase [Chiloscyllium plagiosum]XP_043570868.1 kynurenine formamidase [Chiloscyllium plagiosum]
MNRMSLWKEMNKDELNKQYSPSCWSHRMDKDTVIAAHIKEITKGTEQGRNVAQTWLDVAYGQGDGETLDVYLPPNPSPAPALLIYFHGGYWQLLSKDLSGFMVPPLNKAGVIVVAVDYTLAPKGSMDLIVSQVRRSVAFIVQQYSSLSGVYLCGHSAGAHVGAMVLCTDWKEYGISPDIKGALLVSGIYDLCPIVHTFVNDPLKMTEADALRNSPMRFVNITKQLNGNCEIIIAVAQHDSDEFRKQSQEYYQAIKAAGLKVSFQDVPNTDHFDIIEKLVDENYFLTQVLLKMVIRR